MRGKDKKLLKNPASRKAAASPSSHEGASPPPREGRAADFEKIANGKITFVPTGNNAGEFELEFNGPYKQTSEAKRQAACRARNLKSGFKNVGSTPLLRTLQRRLKMSQRSVHVKEKEVQPTVQAGCC